MIAATNAKRIAREARTDASAHVFAVGQHVRLRSGFGKTPGTTEIYQVTGRLPPRGNSPQYRIRNDEERYERVTTQDDLEAADVEQSGASLAERTFGHG